MYDKITSIAWMKEMNWENDIKSIESIEFL